MATQPGLLFPRTALAVAHTAHATDSINICKETVMSSEWTRCRAPVQAAQGPMPAESPALPASMATAIGAVYGALLQLLMPPAPPLCSKAAVELAKEVALGLAVAHKSVEEMAQALVAGPLSSFTGSDLAKRVEAVSAAAQAVVAGQDAFAEWMGARAAASAQQRTHILALYSNLQNLATICPTALSAECEEIHLSNSQLLR
eukprot:SAG31_NODE_231_length_19768_cov_9.498170_14_plen_202_part_00